MLVDCIMPIPGTPVGHLFSLGGTVGLKIESFHISSLLFFVFFSSFCPHIVHHVKFPQQLSLLSVLQSMHGIPHSEMFHRQSSTLRVLQGIWSLKAREIPGNIVCIEFGYDMHRERSQGFRWEIIGFDAVSRMHDLSASIALVKRVKGSNSCV